MTVTSQIHIGTLAWAAGAVTAGAGRSNGGQVYRAVNSGTSAAPGPTHTSGTVTDGGGVQWKWLSAFDYSTFDTWYASIPATLADAYVGLLWNHGEVVTTGVWQFTSRTTTPTFGITLQPAPGEGFADAASPRLYYDPSKGFALRGTSNYSTLVEINADNVTLRGVQVSNTGANGRTLGGGGVGQVSGCIFVSSPSTQASGSVSKMFNCLFVSQNASQEGLTLQFGASMVNCTLVRPSNQTPGGKALNAAYGTSTVRNCAVFGFTAAPTGTYDTDGHNAGDNATAVPGSTGNLTSVAYTTATFVQPSIASTPDYRLPTGSALIGAGVTDTTNVPGSKDIFGTTRQVPWSIGAFQPYSAPPPIRKPIMFVA